MEEQTEIRYIPRSYVDIAAIMRSGQMHLWEEAEDGFYYVCTRKQQVLMKTEGGAILFRGTTEESISDFWAPFLDETRCYTKINQEISQDAYVREALQAHPGMRLLRQDPYETMIEFILSANNNIPRIMRSLRLLCENYGDYLGFFAGKMRYALPTPQRLSKIDREELRKRCGVGYRDQYLISLGESIVDGTISLDEMRRMADEELLKALISCKGVGEKVAHCIMLFGFQRWHTFPVDVWIERILREHYLMEGASRKSMTQFGLERFGEYAGYVQQLLFLYERRRHTYKSDR